MSADAGPGLTCHEADEWMDKCLGSDETETPKPLADHLAVCQRCARLHGWLSTGVAADSEPVLSDTICARIRSSLHAVRPLPSGSVLAMRFIGIFAVLAAVFIAVTGVGGAGNLTAVQLASVAALFLCATVLLLLSVTRQMTPGQQERIPAGWVIGAFAAGFVTVVAILFPWEGSAAAVRRGWPCTKHGLALALPAGLLLLFLAIRGAPLSYARMGATLGAAAGLLGLMVLQYSCGNQHAGHLMLWHGGIVVLSVAAGYAAGKAADHLSRLRLRKQIAEGDRD